MTCSEGRRNIAQSDGAGIELAVLREEALRKAIPAIAQFVDLGGRNHVYIGERNQLHASRGDRVESGQLAAGSIQSEGKLLCAVPKEISAGHVVPGGETVVNFPDKAAQVIE